MRLATPGLAALALGLTLSGTAVAQQRFDGAWSVEIITERGDCDRAYRYNVSIENGQVSAPGLAGVDVSGRVQANGRVQGSIGSGQNRATVQGQLRGGMGTGTWTASGSRNCSGRWNAERRG